MRVSIKDVVTLLTSFISGIYFHATWLSSDYAIFQTSGVTKSEILLKSQDDLFVKPQTTQSVTERRFDKPNPCHCPNVEPSVHAGCGRYNLVNIYKSSKYDRAKNMDKVHDAVHFGSKVDILVHVRSQDSYGSVVNFLKNNYAGAGITVASAVNIKPDVDVSFVGQYNDKAKAINEMVKKATKEYVLYIDTDHAVEKPKSDSSIHWLLHFMEQVPLADMIGGSVLLKDPKVHLTHDVMEIPCYRIRHRNWTYTETYEYKQSVGDAMTCDRTSTSFLARTHTLKEKIQFDSDVGELLFEDFFLRAKEKSINIFTKPEVMFHAQHSTSSDSRQHVKVAFSDDAIRFGLKHRVYRLVDSTATVFDLCSKYQGGADGSRNERSMCDYERFMNYWRIQHWEVSFRSIINPW